MPSRRLSERNYDYLRVLRTCLIQNGGWEWRGARGWMFSTEFPHSLRSLATGFLATLGANHLAEREDVRDPFVRRPSNIWRISQFGIDTLAEYERAQQTAPSSELEPGVIVFPRINALERELAKPESIIVPPLAASLSGVECETIFIARHQWDGLALLQTQEPEAWVTLAEIRKAVGRFFSDDASLLFEKALIDVSRPDAGNRMFRATMIGRGARLRDGETNARAAMVHVPGIRVAATAGAGTKHEAPHPGKRRVGPVSGG